MSYRPGLPNVLKSLSMTVNAGEKLGVVGRTGAGSELDAMSFASFLRVFESRLTRFLVSFLSESSIMTALFRLVELNEGKISVDDIDIATLGLTPLRRGLSIIPQEPLLFSGQLSQPFRISLCEQQLTSLLFAGTLRTVSSPPPFIALPFLLPVVVDFSLTHR